MQEKYKDKQIPLSLSYLASGITPDKREPPKGLPKEELETLNLLYYSPLAGLGYIESTIRDLLYDKFTDCERVALLSPSNQNSCNFVLRDQRREAALHHSHRISKCTERVRCYLIRNSIFFSLCCSIFLPYSEDLLILFLNTSSSNLCPLL